MMISGVMTWSRALISKVDLTLVLVGMLATCLLEFPVFAVEPSFGVPHINVTIIEGETAVLPCSIQYLGDHQVVWTDAEAFLLTLRDRRIIDDDRISVERPFTKDWNLHIRNVMYEDQGIYICQINTTPVKIKEVSLIVLVPPSIIEESSSIDTTVREGERVTLVCNASGVPQPNVTWFRIPNQPMQEKERIGTTGEVLIIHNVSRDCGGTYECEADNGIGQVKRQMKVDVQYAPEVYLPETRMGQYMTKETFLQCEISAHPHGIMYWSKDGLDFNIGERSAKYAVEMFNSDSVEKKILSLRIRSISMEDFGRYVCTAKNFLGQDKESMYLYDYGPRRNITTTARPSDLTTSHQRDKNGNYGTNVNKNIGYETFSNGNSITRRPPNRNRGNPGVVVSGENMGALGSTADSVTQSRCCVVMVMNIGVTLFFMRVSS